MASWLSLHFGVHLPSAAGAIRCSITRPAQSDDGAARMTVLLQGARVLRVQTQQAIRKNHPDTGMLIQAAVPGAPPASQATAASGSPAIGG